MTKIIIFILDATRYDIFHKYININKLNNYFYIADFPKVFSASSWTTPSIKSMLTATYPFTQGNPLRINTKPLLLEFIQKYIKIVGLNSGNFLLEISGIQKYFYKYINLASKKYSYSKINNIFNKIRNSVIRNISNLAVALKDFYNIIKTGIYPYKPFIIVKEYIKSILNNYKNDNIMLYVHIMDTHPPWISLSKFVSENPHYFDDIMASLALMYFDTTILSQRQLDILLKIYEKSINITLDKLTRFILDLPFLVNDDLIIVITADHGEGFSALNKYDRFHEIYKPNKRMYFLFYDQLHIPLILMTNNDNYEKIINNININNLMSNIDIMPLLTYVVFSNSFPTRKIKHITNILDTNLFNIINNNNEFTVIAETPSYRKGLSWKGYSLTILSSQGYKFTISELLGYKLTNIYKDKYELYNIYDKNLLKYFIDILKKRKLDQINKKIRYKIYKNIIGT